MNLLSKFKNVNKKKNAVPLQEREGSNVVLKKRGRPRKPNRRIFQLRMDVDEHAALKAFAKKRDMDISEAARQAIRSMLQNDNRKEDIKETLIEIIRSN